MCYAKVVYIRSIQTNMRHHDNEQISTTTTALRPSSEGGPADRGRGCGRLSGSIPLSAQVPYLLRR